MRIPVDSIDDRGREVRLGLGDAWAVKAADTAFEAAPEALSAVLRVQRLGPVIQVRGEVAAASKQPCDRCGEPVTVSVSSEVDLAYVPEAGGSGEVQLQEGDLDVGTFTGDMLDLSDVLAESITLALPSRILCTDTAACEARASALLASPEATDASPFAALAGIVRDA